MTLNEKARTQLVMVDFHGGVGQRAKDGDDGDLPDGHLTHRLQVLVPLLDVHLVLLARSRNQLRGHRKGRGVRVSLECSNLGVHRKRHNAEWKRTWTCEFRSSFYSHLLR